MIAIELRFNILDKTESLVTPKKQSSQFSFPYLKGYFLKDRGVNNLLRCLRVD